MFSHVFLSPNIPVTFLPFLLPCTYSASMEAELEKKRLKKIASEEKSRKRTQIVADVDPDDEDRSTGSQVLNFLALIVQKYKY